MGMNTKTIRVKEYRDYSRGGTPQERHMENVERGYTTSDTMTAVAVKYEVIEGKRYRVSRYNHLTGGSNRGIMMTREWSCCSQSAE